MAWHASQRGAIRRPGGPAAGVPALVGPSGRAAVAVAPHPAQLHPHQQQHCVQHAAAPNDAAGAARSRRPCALGPSCRRTTVLARASQQQQPAYNPQPQQQQQQYAWPQQQPQFAAPPQQQQQVPPFGAPAQQQAPNATAALVRSRQPQPAGNAPRAVQPQQVNIEMSQVVGKQVITRTTGRNLGVISAMWVDPVQMQVVSLDLDDKKGVGATRISNFPLSRLTQIGDVVLVHDEEVLYDQPLDGRYGFYLLPGMEVRTRSGEFLGKVRDFTFSPDNGAIARIVYDDFGLGFLPVSFFDTYSLPSADVLNVGVGGMIVPEEARYRERRESPGVFAAIPSLLRSLNSGGNRASPNLLTDGYRSGAGAGGGVAGYLPQGYSYQQWEADVRRWEAETGLSYEQYTRGMQQQQQQLQLPGPRAAAAGPQQPQQPYGRGGGASPPQQQQQQQPGYAPRSPYPPQQQQQYGAPAYGAAAPQPQQQQGYWAPAPPQQQQQPQQVARVVGGQQQQQPLVDPRARVGVPQGYPTGQTAQQGVVRGPPVQPQQQQQVAGGWPAPGQAPQPQPQQQQPQQQQRATAGPPGGAPPAQQGRAAAPPQQQQQPASGGGPQGQQQRAAGYGGGQPQPAVGAGGNGAGAAERSPEPAEVGAGAWNGAPRQAQAQQPGGVEQWPRN